MPNSVKAIEIANPETWEMLCALDSHFRDLDYEFNKGFFVALEEEGVRWTIMSPRTVGEIYDHIEPDQTRIKFVTLVRK